MSIRLSRVLPELNIGLRTAVDYLKNKKSLGGISDDANVNTKITDEQYQALVSEFKGDKDLKSEAEKVFAKKAKEKKEERKASSKAEDLLEKRQQYKPMGKIDLSTVGKPQPKPAPAPAPKAEAKPQAQDKPQPEPCPPP